MSQCDTARRRVSVMRDKYAHPGAMVKSEPDSVDLGLLPYCICECVRDNFAFSENNLHGSFYVLNCAVMPFPTTSSGTPLSPSA